MRRIHAPSPAVPDPEGCRFLRWSEIFSFDAGREKIVPIVSGNYFTSALARHSRRVPYFASLQNSSLNTTNPLYLVSR
jgi:hypothetical protein